MPRLVICPSCFKDMSGVSVAARFCPKCGKQLPARDASGFLIAPEESSPLYSVYSALRDELEDKLASEAPQVASSMIILAYANAMLHLGWKYEHGRGLLRNLEEASRCYAKASRLSEAWGK
jgi:TPR repeat protein